MREGALLMRGHEAPARSADVSDLELRHSRGMLSMTARSFRGKQRQTCDLVCSARHPPGPWRRRRSRTDEWDPLQRGGRGSGSTLHARSGAARRLGVGLAMAVVPSGSSNAAWHADNVADESSGVYRAAGLGVD